MVGSPLSQVSEVWGQRSFSLSFVAWVVGVVAGEARGLVALPRTAPVRERATGRGCVRHVGDVPIGERRGLGEELELGGCRDEHQGIWRPLVL